MNAACIFPSDLISNIGKIGKTSHSFTQMTRPISDGRNYNFEKVDIIRVEEGGTEEKFDRCTFRF